MIAVTKLIDVCLIYVLKYFKTHTPTSLVLLLYRNVNWGTMATALELSSLSLALAPGAVAANGVPRMVAANDASRPASKTTAMTEEAKAALHGKKRNAQRQILHHDAARKSMAHCQRCLSTRTFEINMCHVLCYLFLGSSSATVWTRRQA